MQVVWLGLPEDMATWEPACSLPPSIVADYEAGITTEAEMHTATTYGHSFTTFAVTKRDNKPRPKKRKEQRPSHASLEGYVLQTFNKLIPPKFIVRCSSLFSAKCQDMLLQQITIHCLRVGMIFTRWAADIHYHLPTL